MKLLLDENIPKKLKTDFYEFDVFSVQEMGWSGVKNGDLLNLMLLNSFEILITADKNLQHQQNFQKYPIPVIVLSPQRFTYEYFSLLIPKVKEVLNNRLPPEPYTVSLHQ